MPSASPFLARSGRLPSGFLLTLLTLGALAGLVRPVEGQGFGSAAVVVADEVLVAEPIGERAPGRVLLYRRAQDGSWREAARLEASDGTAGNGFGRSLAAGEDVLWVGAPGAGEGTGAVYLFRRDGSGVWEEALRLSPPEAVPEMAFGTALAAEGDLLLVGSPGYREEDDDPAGERRGTVHVFRRDAASGEWRPAGRLSTREVGPGDGFGRTVALAGDLAAVGAPARDRRSGAVFLFRQDGESGRWRPAGTLASADAGPNAFFGSAVLVGEERVIVGAPAAARFSGSVFVFEPGEETETWERVVRLVPFDAESGGRFGASLGHAEGALWVGAPGAGETGAIYRFRGSEGPEGLTWLSVSKLVPEPVEAGDDLGSVLAVGDGLAVAGLTGDDYGAGSAIVLERTAGGDWTAGDKLLTELENYARVVGGAVPCGNGGRAAHFDCQGVDLLSFLPVSEVGGGRGVRMSDIWGWTDPETGREYALAGRMDGTAFIDVTDPENPRYLGSLPMTEGARAAAWRDIKVYRDHAYVVADGAGDHGMQVFDLTRLREVGEMPVTFDADLLYDRVASVHNLVLNTESGYAYAVGANSGGETCGGGLHMIDVREPKNPTFVGCFADTRTGRQRTGYTHDAQCVVYRGPDEDYQGREICLGANETALSIADVTDKRRPLAVSVATYPNFGYTHQGWFDEEQRYFYLDDELDELQGKVERTRTLVWDLTDLDEPILAHEFYGPTASSDHNLYVVEDRVFQSNYVSGLRVLDISEREAPREVGWFDTVPYGENEPGFGGSWSNYPFFESGIVVVNSGNEGFFVVRPGPGVAPSAAAHGGEERGGNGAGGKRSSTDG